MATLSGRVAVVTGASRGVGKGIALALGEAGATVYVTGRTVLPGSAALPGTIGETAEGVTKRGGRGIAVRCDHADDGQIRALFERVAQEQAGRLDVLVNNVYKIPDPPVWSGGFWEHPVSIWDDQVGIGLRAHYVASVYGAPMMVRARRGLRMDLSRAQSPLFTGRAVVALAADPDVLAKSGSVLQVGELAQEYGFRDE